MLDEKQANEQLTDEHRKWQKQVQEDSQNLREQRMKALSQIDNLKQKLRVSEQAKEAAEMKLVQELDTLEHKLEVREKDMAYRLESCEGSHRKSIHELRNLLTSQHRVGAKYVGHVTSSCGHGIFTCSCLGGGRSLNLWHKNLTRPFPS